MSNYNRNKNTSTKLNTNLTLAQIIELAGTNPEYRIVFYNRFLKDQIYVLVEKDPSGNNNFDDNNPPAIIAFENNRIPVFTHPDRIYDGGAIHEEMDYMKVPSRAFLEMTLGASIIVNPFSKVYKELVVEEIAEMLNGSIFNTLNSPILKAQMNVQIGKPETEPKALIEELKEIFSKNDLIKSAYIGWTFNEILDKEPHYIFAIESEIELANFKEVADIISELCKPHLAKEEYIDIIKLEKNGNFSDYFYNQAEPFYVK
ncbi:enhanced serine sensitivity protein SseB [Myroides sp. M-43]|uniref:enhanced serine sensitivity protein SseB n=1 Tax=Myroides oncorhynchi TaxID=2893756 RepID=UPI001E2F0A0E|nr:enhanced serine sensitivity protein SseB [Myroides oncorhynchi]MCC9043269.1 enhanced serine sensitivity protein SseB [Myroides oncorhynchi]